MTLGAWAGQSVSPCALGALMLDPDSVSPDTMIRVCAAGGAVLGGVLWRVLRRTAAQYSPAGLLLWLGLSWLGGAWLIVAIPLSPVPATPPAIASTWFQIRTFTGVATIFGILIFALTLAFAARSVPIPSGRRPLPWWAGGSVCALVWTITLLVLWPGLMSPDSIDQWGQVLRGSYDDLHPAIHTMTNWLITRLWLSPAAIALAQIVALASVAGWGLSRMTALGCPRSLAWVLCALFALSPVNNPLVITLWKDVPYTIACLVLTFMLLEIATTGGDWLARRWRWAALGLAGAALSLFRQNGPPVAVGTVLILLVAYRSHWRRIVLAGVTMVGLVVAVRGPLYTALKVQPPITPGSLGIVLHHIAAQMHNHTPLTDDQREVLDCLRPGGDWPYDPYTVNPVVYDGRMRTGYLRLRKFDLMRVCAQLVLSRPDVALRHAVISSSVVWRITHPHNSWTSLSLGVPYAGRVVTIAENVYGLHADSRIPALVPAWSAAIATAQRENWLWLTWRPALYLYLTLAGAAVAAVRARNARYLVILCPVLLNELLVGLLAPAQDLRYHYPAYVVGLLLSVFLLWAAPPVPKPELTGGNPPADVPPAAADIR